MKFTSILCENSFKKAISDKRTMYIKVTVGKPIVFTKTLINLYIKQDAAVWQDFCILTKKKGK
jgi:hypothetical protein